MKLRCFKEFEHLSSPVLLAQIRMFDYFELKPFGLGLAVGFLLILFFRPQKDTIYKYPHPQTVEQLIYKDQNGSCYKYNVKEVSCDANEGTLTDYPIQ